MIIIVEHGENAVGENSKKIPPDYSKSTTEKIV